MILTSTLDQVSSSIDRQTFHSCISHIANFIYQNYRQALEKIQIDGVLLANLSVRLKTSNPDYERYLEDERKYLNDLQVEPEEYQFSADYLDLLLKLDTLL